MTAPAQDAPREERAESLTSMLLSPAARKIIEVNLPPGVKLERVARAVAKLANEQPDVLECTGRSIVDAVARGVRFNLELGRQWYIAPFSVKVVRRGHPDRWEKRAQMLLGYHGKIALLKREKIIWDIRASCVFEKEHFVPKLGTAENHAIEHWACASEMHRGALIAAYAAAELRRGGNFVYLMTKEEIARVKEKYSKSWKDKELDEIRWYCQKTCVHQMWKWMAPDLPEYLRDDEEAPREVDGDDEAEAMGHAVAPGSVEEKNLLGAGPVPIVDVTLARDPIAVMQDAQVA
jgi:phage RecT family recombinase